LVTGNPIFGREKEISLIVINERDITELNQLRNQLQEAQGLAQRYISQLSEIEMKGIDLSEVIFRSVEMRGVIEMAMRVAQFDSTVFLLGESGVGKGMIAKLIHKYSNRRNGPFIRINSGAIPDSLIESELFGYERGAFTGARTEGKPGFFQLANHGTLFLDEIGETPVSFQSKLLRFLEDHEVIRVGGTHPVEIDVRILAATNRNIEEMVSRKLFREDLYYRLNVFPINIPPLRERRDDITPLVCYFVERYNEKFDRSITITSEAVDILSRYSFTGNVRELSNTVERLVIMSSGNSIETKDLPTDLAKQMGSLEQTSLDLGVLNYKEAMKRFETILIKKAITRGGTQEAAASLLGINQSTVARKAKRCGLTRSTVIVHEPNTNAPDYV
jgi:transcriptional regulator with PAS, ATPase and Fis domain